MSKRRDTRRHYEVGYGKPPAAHQFKKGASGNPAGRKRRTAGSTNLKTELLAELGHIAPVTENGKQRRLSRQKVLIKKIISDALNGDPKARDQLLRLANQKDAQLESQTVDLIGAAKDAELLARFRADVIQQHRGSKNRGSKK